MWSLRDLQRLNSEALLKRERLGRAVQTGVLDGEEVRTEEPSE